MAISCGVVAHFYLPNLSNNLYRPAFIVLEHTMDANKCANSFATLRWTPQGLLGSVRESRHISRTYREEDRLNIASPPIASQSTDI